MLDPCINAYTTNHVLETKKTKTSTTKRLRTGMEGRSERVHQRPFCFALCVCVNTQTRGTEKNNRRNKILSSLDTQKNANEKVTQQRQLTKLKMKPMHIFVFTGI